MPNSVPTTGNVAISPADVAGVAHQRRQVAGPRHQLDVDVAVELVERGEPGRRRHRIAGERAGVEHRTERRQLLHQVGAAADRADRQAAADDLAEAGEVGRHVVLRLGAARPDPEAGDHLVEDQQGADAIALGAQAGEEPGRRGDHAHVGRDRLDDDRGDLIVEHGHDVVRHDHRLGTAPVGTPAVPGRPSVATPLPPATSSASVAPWKLPANVTMRSRPVAPRARRTAVLVASVPEFMSRTRSQLGTRSLIASASFISRGVGAPNDVPSTGRAAQGLGDGRVGVTEDDRAVALHQVEVGGALRRR